MRWFFAPLLGLLLAGWAQAQPIAAIGLYEGETVVAAGSPAGTPELVRALNQVLERLTGRTGEDLVGALGAGAQTAERLVISRQLVDIEIPGPDQTKRVERRLRAEFDPRGVNRLLAEAGLPRWGQERPLMLLWLVAPGQDRAAVDFVRFDPELEFVIEQSSRRFGLPLIRPMLDAFDLTEVRVADIRGGFTETSLMALQRYGAELVAFAELRPEQGFWTGRWALRLSGEVMNFERSAEGRAEALESGLARIAAILAARYAVIGDRGRTERLLVSGVGSPVHYAEVVRHLESLSLVDSLRLVQAQADQVEFELQLRGDGIERLIGVGSLLQFERREAGSGRLLSRLVW